jgi:hypothetical protein
MRLKRTKGSVARAEHSTSECLLMSGEIYYYLNAKADGTLVGYVPRNYSTFLPAGQAFRRDVRKFNLYFRPRFEVSLGMKGPQGRHGDNKEDRSWRLLNGRRPRWDLRWIRIRSSCAWINTIRDFVPLWRPSFNRKECDATQTTKIYFEIILEY